MSARPRPPAPGFWFCVGFILVVITLAQITGEVVLPDLRPGTLGGKEYLLLALAGASLFGLLVLQGRRLWVMMGNIRYALALVFVWGLSSVIGTLVVQRFPFQTDEGYRRGFIEATGDFLYHAASIGGGVVVHPQPDVIRWWDEQRQLFGDFEADELEKQWLQGEELRLTKAEIGDFITRHQDALDRTLDVVSALRLPEAFQMSVWFKAILGLLCVALVIVVIQRWRGEWRQAGWVMAHGGMIIFILGAAVRGASKVDGQLQLHVGLTADFYDRNEIATRVPTPLGFDVTLERFKTEYPKQLFVTLTGVGEGGQKGFRITPGWEREFLDQELTLTVEDVEASQERRRLHEEAAEGPPDPAVLLELVGASQPVENVLFDTQAFAGPEGSYLFEYRRAANAEELERLVSSMEEIATTGTLQTVDGQRLAGPVEPGALLDVPGADLQLEVLNTWPDYGRRAEPEAQELSALDPAAEVEVLQDGSVLGTVLVFVDRMLGGEGLPLDAELRFDVDWWRTSAPSHFRLVDAPGSAPQLVTFRRGELVGREPWPVGETRSFPGAAGQQDDEHEHAEADAAHAAETLRLARVFERYEGRWTIGPADVSGMSADDVYYASLPSSVTLSLRGPAALRCPDGSSLADHLGELVEHAPRVALDALGLVDADAFARGEGHAALTADGRGLALRLLSDDAAFASFPSPFLAEVLEMKGVLPSIRLDWVTNTRGSPLRFTSDVTLSKDGHPLKRSLIEPNRPLYFLGWQFSQADFRAEDPTFSGLGVVRDPSVPYVYTGMALVVLGVILLFYVNPLITGRYAPAVPESRT